jgi:hypothetical protein
MTAGTLNKRLAVYTKLPVKSTEKLGLRQDIVDYLKLLPKMEVGRRRKFEDI